jgi:hypothetical protein
MFETQNKLNWFNEKKDAKRHTCIDSVILRRQVQRRLKQANLVGGTILEHMENTFRTHSEHEEKYIGNKWKHKIQNQKSKLRVE